MISLPSVSVRVTSIQRCCYATRKPASPAALRQQHAWAQGPHNLVKQPNHRTLGPITVGQRCMARIGKHCALRCKRLCVGELWGARLGSQHSTPIATLLLVSSRLEHDPNPTIAGLIAPCGASRPASASWKSRIASGCAGPPSRSKRAARSPRAYCMANAGTGPEVRGNCKRCE